MSVSEADMKLKQAANHATDDASTQGGAMSATEITNAAPGEWSTRLKGKSSGTVDDSGDITRQFAVAYIHNTHSTDQIDDCGYFQENGIADFVTPGVVKLTSTSTSDDSTVRARVYGLVSGALAYEDIVLNGTTQVVGLLTFSRIERITLQEVASPNALWPAAGRVDIEVGTGQLPGYVPVGFSHATREHEYATASVIGDRPTWANRITDPGGLAWSRAYTNATRVYVRNDSADATLLADKHQAVYRRTTVQPGMPSDIVACVGRIYGTAP